ncbi:hypothetical protein MLD38_030696 [Melastoma candidum]|uniref:Uncharacterized protein n=1 Tax=Melastoma candidum TaxID=119954 RepID=A0ACB9MMG2_9MYRT|nr:hypothetical protein MLD38_030696 [Melastoma candidum]
MGYAMGSTACSFHHSLLRPPPLPLTPLSTSPNSLRKKHPAYACSSEGGGDADGDRNDDLVAYSSPYHRNRREILLLGASSAPPLLLLHRLEAASAAGNDRWFPFTGCRALVS